MRRLVWLFTYNKVRFSPRGQCHWHATNSYFSRQCSQYIKSAKILADHCIYSLSILRSYSETCLKWPLKEKTKNGFQDQLSLNEGQKYCRMLPLEHSAILSTFIKLPFAMKIFVLPICEWPLNNQINGSEIPVIDAILDVELM